MLKTENGAFLDTVRVYILAIKYFMQGDKWKFAVEYAESIVKGFKKQKQKKEKKDVVNNE